ncbi:MAG: hypothetical protein FWC50_15275 [Planctomycetaceae bacterium]|nr:hypothetical protein [Planctomycetaceae bacterium]
MSKQPGQVIVDRINKIRRQVLRVELATTLVTLAVCLVAYLFVAAVFDHWVFRNGLPAGLRYVLLIAGACAALVYFVLRMVPLFRYPVNPAYAAEVLEQWHSGMKNRLVNWVFLKRGNRNVNAQINAQVERQVIDRIGQETLRNLDEIPDQLVVDCSAAIRWAITFVVVFALFCAYTIFSPKNALQSSVRAMMPFLDVDVPQGITIREVKPGDATVYQGDVIQVSARMDRSTKLPVHIVYSTNDGRYAGQRVPMQDSGDGYLFESRFPPGKKGFEESLSYHIEVGGCCSKAWSVTVKPSIAIDVQSVEYCFPGYTKLAPQKIEAGGDIRAVEGTEAAITAKSNIGMSRAAIMFDNDANRMMPLEISGDDKTVARGKFSLGFDPHHPEKPVCTSYTLRCWDENRRDNPMPSQYRVEVIHDAAPRIEWANKINENEPVQIPLNQPFDVAVTAEDPDFGLQHIQLKGTVTRVKQTAGVQADSVSQETNVPLETRDLPLETIELLRNPPRAGKTTLKITLVPAKLQLYPGDRVSYFVEAVDTKEPDANTSATSPRFFIVTDSDRNQPQNPNVNDQPREENDKNGQQEKQENSRQRQDSQKGRDVGNDDKNDGVNNDKNDRNDDSTQKSGQKNEPRDPQKEEPRQKDNKQKDEANRNDQKGKDDRQNKSGGQQPFDQEGKQDKGEQNKGTQNDGDSSANGKNDSEGKGKQDSSDNGEKSNNSAKPENGPNDESGFQEQNNQGQPDGDSQHQGTGNQQTFASGPQSESEQNSQPGQHGNVQNNNQNDNDRQKSADRQKQNGENATGNVDENADKNTAKNDNADNRGHGRDSSPRREKPVDGVSNPGEVFQEVLDQMQKSRQATDSSANPSKSDSAKSDSLNNAQNQRKVSNQPPDSPPEDMPDRHDDTQTTDRTDAYKAKEGNDPNAQNVDPSTDKKVFQDKNDQGVGSEEAEGEGRKLDGSKFEGTQSGHHANEKVAGEDEKATGRSNVSNAKTGSTAQQQPDHPSQRPAERQPEQQPAQKGVPAENGTQQNGAAADPQDHLQQEKQPLDSRTPNTGLPTDRKPDEAAVGDDGMPQHLPQRNLSQNRQQDRQPGQNEKTPATNDGGPDQTGDGGGSSANRQNNRLSEPNLSQNQSSEEANPEYAKKATSLAIEYLENELAKEHPNQQLLDRLGWNRDDLQKFTDRWKQMQRRAENAPDNSKEAKQWDELMKNVGRLAPKSTIGERRDAQYRVTTTTAESHRYPPPKGSKYEQRVKAYTESVGIGEGIRENK